MAAMGPDKVREIELSLGVSLPLDYKTVLAEDPLGQFRESSRPEVMCDAVEIVSLNLELRRSGFFGMDWKENMIAIGTDMAGGVYYINTIDGLGAVYIAAHDGGPIDDEVAHPNLLQWVDELRSDLERWAARPKGRVSFLEWRRRRRT